MLFVVEGSFLRCGVEGWSWGVTGEEGDRGMFWGTKVRSHGNTGDVASGIVEIGAGSHDQRKGATPVWSIGPGGQRTSNQETQEKEVNRIETTDATDEEPTQSPGLSA